MNFKLRYFSIIVIVGALVAVLAARLFDLQILEQKFLRKQGDLRTLRTVSTPANRGMILDRSGEPLAISTEVKSIWANPQKINLENSNLRSLAKLLDMDLRTIVAKLKTNMHKEFVYLKRQVNPAVALKVKNLQIAGIELQTEYKRFYPTAEVNAPVLGSTDIDDHGKEGLELAYNGWLTGKAGKRRVLKDCLGREIQYLETIQSQGAGKNLVASLDQRLQYLAYSELKLALESNAAISGSAVVLDVTTGEVLAMVNLPSFNPNMRSNGSYSIARKNQAVTDFMEPGSVVKPFSLASILESGEVNANTIVDTSPGVFKVTNHKGEVARDLHNFGKIDIATILLKSSNVGMSKLILKYPANNLWDMYDRLGFGDTTGSGFPGESAGILNVPHKNRPFALATMSFGYGLAVTPLQLARAYAILGAHGIKRPTTFAKLDEPLAGVQVISPKIAREVVDLLVTVAKGYKSADISGYNVAGKSGTTRKLGKHGYDKNRHRAVFGGLVPAVNPKFSIVVTLDEPSAGKYYGTMVAAPVFAKIGSAAVRLFNVQPDLMQTQGVFVAQGG